MSSGDPGEPELLRARSIKMIQFLLDKGVNVNSKSTIGRNILHIYQDPTVMAFLLSKGCDPNARDKFGMTPLAIAMREKEYIDGVKQKHGEDEVGKERFEKSRAAIELLKRHGATL